MSETNQNSTAANGGTNSGPAAAGASATAGVAPTPAADSQVKPSAPPTGGNPSEPKKRGAQAALERAQARMAAQGGKPNTPPAKPAEQAPGATAGASTQGTDDGKGQGKPAAGAAGAEEGGKPISGSTVTAPEDWPAQYREKFSKLPTDDARTMLLDFYKDMQGGYTRATTELSQQREQHKELFAWREQFDSDPKAAIQALAQRAKVEVFFERPLPAGEVPDFKDPKEMASWIAAETDRKVAKMAEERDQKAAEQRRKDEAALQLRAELTDAAKAHADFGELKPRIFEKLAAVPGLSVEDAYSLVTLPALVKAAQDGAAAAKELGALKAQIETERKKATQPPVAAGNGQPKPEDAHLSPAQRAHRRATAKLAAQGNAAA